MTSHPYFKGSLLALTTMCIWSGWNVVTRLGVTHALSAWDITFLRFLTAGIVSLPLVWRYREALLAAPRHLMLLMVMGAGAPYVLMASFGFRAAPASHGVLIPGTMTLWVAILSAAWLGERFDRSRIVGYGLIGLTICYRLWTHAQGNLDYLFADGYFLVAGLMWAIYTVTNKKIGLAPLAAVALISFGSLIGYCLPYALHDVAHVMSLSIKDSLLQIIYQGVIVSFVALVCYNRAMVLMGPSRTAAFAALIPLLATLMGIPLLGEYPRQSDILFVLLLSGGVLLATGFVKFRR